jgi:hypothetical protein
VEELLETEAIEEAPGADVAEEIPTRRLPEPVSASSEVSVWRDEMRTAAIAAAGGLVAGAATVAVVRASRSAGSRRKPARRKPLERPARVIASRSFLVDVHLLGSDR